jgi:DNA-binding HxlR family transcriptional regulator
MMNHTPAATEVIDIMARKWTIEVVEKLKSGPMRYNMLLKKLDDQVTPKVFTRVLRRLEAECIVEREMVNGSPPGVQYELTSFGHSLLAALDELAKLWAAKRQISD